MDKETYRNRNALLIVDVQVDVMRTAWDAARIIGNIAITVEKAREQGVPVIWVQHADEELVAGSDGWQIVPELVPALGEVVIRKHYNSAFEHTTLVETLNHLGTTRIVLAGAATNWCIRATAYAALERGYNLTLIKDAHTTENIEYDDGLITEAIHIVRDLNVAMTWLSYPGRSNSTVPAAELDFLALE